MKTLRDEFALVAPNMPDWFKVKTEPEPPSLVSTDGTEFYSIEDARRSGKDIQSSSKWEAWNEERQRKRTSEWPYAYADMVMSASGEHVAR